MSLNERVCIVLHHLYLDGRCEHNNLFTPLIKKETVTSGLHASRAWCTEWRHQARVLRFRAKGYPSQSLKYIRHLHATWGRKSDAGGSALLSFRGSHPRINLHDAILLEVVLHLHSTYTHNPMGQVQLTRAQTQKCKKMEFRSLRGSTQKARQDGQEASHSMPARAQ